MKKSLVLLIEDGRVKRIMSDAPLDIDCMIVYADVPPGDRGQPWVRALTLPSNGERREVLVDGMALDVSPADVAAVVEASDRMRTQVMTLLQDTPESDEGRE